MAFTRNVFVNCPFDKEYLPLLHPLLFTIVFLGFKPRIALETLDSGKPRINKIISLIEASKYAIHDLSRLRAERKGEYFRLNMPFELGLDVGCRQFGGRPLSTKRCLILEAKRYRFQAAISDLSNSDIAAHANQPKRVVTEVRNWLNGQAALSAPGPSEIWARFNEFLAATFNQLKAQGFSAADIERLPTGELIDNMSEWVRALANARAPDD